MSKKVLLRERKRHTAHCIAVASACYSGGVPGDGGPPLSKVGVPPRPRLDQVPPPPPTQMVDKVKTLPPVILRTRAVKIDVDCTKPESRMIKSIISLSELKIVITQMFYLT